MATIPRGTPAVPSAIPVPISSTFPSSFSPCLFYFTVCLQFDTVTDYVQCKLHSYAVIPQVLFLGCCRRDRCYDSCLWTKQCRSSFLSRCRGRPRAVLGGSVTHAPLHEVLFLPGFSGTRHSSPEQHESVTDVCIRKESCSPCRAVRWHEVSLAHEGTPLFLSVPGVYAIRRTGSKGVCSAEYSSTRSVQVEFLYVLLRVWCLWQLRALATFAHKGLAGFALGSNMIAICINTSAYIGVTIFSFCGLVGVLVGFEATKFLSATGVGLLIAVACSVQGEFLCVVLRLLVSRATAAKDALLLTSAKKHPTQFCFASTRLATAVRCH